MKQIKKPLKDIISFCPCSCKLMITFLLILQSLTLVKCIYFPGSPTLNRLLKVHNAKSLRNDLLNHKKYVEDMITYLDEWAFDEIKQITNNNQLSILKIKWLDRELNKTRNDIKQLSTDLNNDTYNVNNIKERYSKLQIHLQKISDHFDENNRDTLRLFKEYFGNSFPNLIETHENLLYQLSVVNRLIDVKKSAFSLHECIQAIRDKEFEKAVQKFIAINDDSTLTHIIKEVYNSSESNFDIILNFGNKIRNITQSFQVYTILIYEMELNGHNKNAYRIIDLIKSLKSEIIYQIKTISSTKKDALALEEFLIKKLKFIAKEKLENSVLNDSYHFNVPLFEKIILLDENIFSEISYSVLRDFYKDSSATTSVFGWIMEGFTQILEKIFTNNLLDKFAFKLAYYIEDLLIMSNFDDQSENVTEGLGKILKEQLRTFTNRLPDSIRNVVFLGKVCIKNVGLSEYLQSTNRTLINNKYSVFTSKSNVNYTQQELLWKITRSHGNVYNIQNSEHNTYLYTSDIDDSNEHKSDGHNVFTWLSDNDESLSYAIWQIIPVGEYCHIKNTLHNEYLYASESTIHMAFTASTLGKNESYFKWHIINCI